MKKIYHVLFAVYLIVLLRITVFRSNFSFSNLMQNGKLDLVPFNGIFDIAYTDPVYFIILFFGNILWFVPLGFYVHFIMKKSLRLSALCGFILSLVIEVSQYVFGTGFTDVEDLILNTLGAFLGALAASIISKLTEKKHGTNLDNII